jgi:hypothetical protein
LPRRREKPRADMTTHILFIGPSACRTTFENALAHETVEKSQKNLGLLRDLCHDRQRPRVKPVDAELRYRFIREMHAREARALQFML